MPYGHRGQVGPWRVVGIQLGSVAEEGIDRVQLSDKKLDR